MGARLDAALTPADPGGPGRWDHGLSSAIVEDMRSVVGLSAARETLNAFELFLGENESPERRRAMATYRNPMTGVFSSTCGLGIRAAWRHCGVNDPHCRVSYATRLQRAISDLREYAQSVGAWVDADPKRRPKPGAHVELASSSGGHVFVVDGIDGSVLSSIDFGQVTLENEQMCAFKDRRWVVENGSIWDTSTLRPRESGPYGFDSPTKRRVIGWSDPDRLPFTPYE